MCWYYANMPLQPLTPVFAKTLIKRLLAEGEVVFAEPHMSQRMAQRNIQRLDVMNVLLRGKVDEAELENGEYRYRVWTLKFTVIVAFPEDEETVLVVITCWRT